MLQRNSFFNHTTSTSMADTNSRNWEDMELDCVAGIFSKLALDDLAVSIPFVCRAWFVAAHDPLCWKLLNLHSLNFMPWSNFARRFTDQNSVTRFTFSGFLKLVVRRSAGIAAELRLPELVSTEDLILALNECKRLRTIALPKLTSDNEAEIPYLISKWKDLEQLQFESKPSNFPHLSSAISQHCKNITELAIPCSSIKKEDASAIVTCFPKLRSLEMSRSFVSKDEILMILEGCRELERVCAKNCVGFGEEDEEIRRKGSRIRIFDVEGSKIEDYEGYETDECDEMYVHVI